MFKLRDALQDSEDLLKLSDDESFWKFIEVVMVAQGVKRYFTATPNIDGSHCTSVTSASPATCTSSLDQRLFLHMATVLQRLPVCEVPRIVDLLVRINISSASFDFFLSFVDRYFLIQQCFPSSFA